MCLRDCFCCFSYGVATYYVATADGPYGNNVPPDTAEWRVTAGTAPIPVLTYFCTAASVASATWTADDGASNRDGGTMNDVMGALNGGNQYVRFRTGGTASFTLDMELSTTFDVEGVSITVGESPDTAGEGYSGIEISTSTDGSTYTVSYARYEMFGNFERSAEHQTMAAEWAIDTPTAHRFDNIAVGTTNVRVRMWRADISGDNSVTFNSLSVDPVGGYATGCGAASRLPQRMSARSTGLRQPQTTDTASTAASPVQVACQS